MGEAVNFTEKERKIFRKKVLPDLLKEVLELYLKNQSYKKGVPFDQYFTYFLHRLLKEDKLSNLNFLESKRKIAFDSGKYFNLKEGREEK